MARINPYIYFNGNAAGGATEGFIYASLGRIGKFEKLVSVDDKRLVSLWYEEQFVV